MNLIKCGREVTSHPHYHLTSSDVQACYADAYRTTTLRTPFNPTRFDREGHPLTLPNSTPPRTSPTHPQPVRQHPQPTAHTPTQPQRPYRPTTPAQADYYHRLTTMLNLPNNISSFDGWSISPELDRLKALRTARNTAPKPTSATAFIDPFPPNPNAERNATAHTAHLLATKFANPRQHPELSDGIYIKNNVIYKVVHAVHGSGRQYAKKFSPSTKKFTMAKGAIWNLTPNDAISPEQAKDFGKLYGMCVFCSRTLTDERSIHAGYGSTCASNHGLPWGDN